MHVVDGVGTRDKRVFRVQDDGKGTLTPLSTAGETEKHFCTTVSQKPEKLE